MPVEQNEIPITEQDQIIFNHLPKRQ